MDSYFFLMQHTTDKKPWITFAYHLTCRAKMSDFAELKVSPELSVLEIKELTVKILSTIAEQNRESAKKR